MTITEDRQKVLDFSEPYFDATQALLVKKGSPIKGLEDLDGKSVGVQLGTTGADYVRANAPKGAKIKEFEDLALLTTAVKTGQTDAGVNDNGVLFDYVKTNPDTRGGHGVRHRGALRLRRRQGPERRAAEDRRRGDRRGQERRHLRQALQEVLR